MCCGTLCTLSTLSIEICPCNVSNTSIYPFNILRIVFANMSPAPCGNDAALPHTRGVSSFNLSHSTCKCVFTPEVQTAGRSSPALGGSKHAVFDESAQCGSWDSNITVDGDGDGDGDFPTESVRHRPNTTFGTLLDFLRLVCVIGVLAACAVFLGVDLAFGQVATGRVLADCIVRYLPLHLAAQEVSPVYLATNCQIDD